MEISMATALMLIGHQYVGKTTFIDKILSRVERPTHYFSLDHELHKILESKGLEYNTITFGENVKEADANAKQNFMEAMKRGDDIIIDRTNLRRKGRMRIINQLKPYGY